MNGTPMHHPAEASLLRHAAGRLPCGHSLVIATHLPFCLECQAAIRLDEAVGGALLASTPPAELAADALTRVLARLDLPASVARSEPETAALANGVLLPASLRGMVKPVWRWVAPGVSRIIVDAQGAAADERICLLRVAPGKSLPDHRHRGWEATCVLAGRFTDVTGEYGPGDVAELDVAELDGDNGHQDGGHQDGGHQPVAGPDEACICLIAWEGSLRMRGLGARLLQPLIGV